jgi:predicted N-acetyltransferase YhbS
MTPEIRQIREDEVAAFLDAITTAFLDRPDVARVAAEVLPLWDLRRCWAAFDGERLCGTFRSWATELTVPGGTQLPASAIAAVTVLPTHRRRGILRRMAAAEHAAIRERGEVFGLLYAAEYPIYGRLGYGPGCQSAMWTLDANATGFHRAATGSVELLRLDAESRALVKALFDARRAVSPGEIWRRDFIWDHDLI